MTQEPVVLKEASCLSLSGTSEITYHLGNQGGNIHIRLTGNSGNGIFNGYWVPLPKILAVLNDQERPFIWSALCPLFEGRSVNSACFLMGILLAEKLVQTSREQPRHYEVCDPEPFMAKVQALMAPKPAKPKKGVKKEPPIAPPAEREAIPVIDPLAESVEPIVDADSQSC